MKPYQHSLGLSLSGGGYRAAAFHLGTLEKLREMKILDSVEVISSISGGSILAAAYCLKDKEFDEFAAGIKESLHKEDVIKKVFLSWMFAKAVIFVLLFWIPAIYFLFTTYAWLFPVIIFIFFILLFRFQFTIFPVSARIEKLYDRFFCHKKKLGQLADKPILVLGSTNLETARPFTFSKSWMQDSTYQYLRINDIASPVKFKAEDFPVARAVMASSSVPVAFTPVGIAKEYFADPENDFDRVHPQLVDGGVYDNQGIHKIMQQGSYSCKIVIASDAGNKLIRQGNAHNLLQVAFRCMDVFMARIKNVQMVQDIYDNTSSANKEIAYLSLGWDVEECIPRFVDNLASKNITQYVIDAHGITNEWADDPEKNRAKITAHLKETTSYNSISKPTPGEVKIARTVSTNLTGLTKARIDCLMKLAAALTELQVKLYTPSLVQI